MENRMIARGAGLYYETHGSGEPLVLLHGFPLSGRMWDGVVARLRGWRVIVPDLRGHGRSDASSRVGMGGYVRDVVAILEREREGRPAVVAGLSMGGYVAMELYRRFPERVRALVLADTRASADTADVADGRRASAKRVLREGSQVVTEGMVDKLFAPSAGRELREEWRQAMAETPPMGVAAALRAMAARDGSHRLLGRATVPVLAVVGAEDVMTPPSEVRAIAEAAPGGRLKVISDAGHLSPLERPEEFSAVLRDFLRSLPPLPRQGRG